MPFGPSVGGSVYLFIIYLLIYLSIHPSVSQSVFFLCCFCTVFIRPSIHPFLFFNFQVRLQTWLWCLCLCGHVDFLKTKQWDEYRRKCSEVFYSKCAIQTSIEDDLFRLMLTFFSLILVFFSTMLNRRQQHIKQYQQQQFKRHKKWRATTKHARRPVYLDFNILSWRWAIERGI